LQFKQKKRDLRSLNMRSKFPTRRIWEGAKRQKERDLMGYHTIVILRL
jgi:hypothetical protein